jgi:hypothetical protein
MLQLDKDYRLAMDYFRQKFTDLGQERYNNAVDAVRYATGAMFAIDAMKDAFGKEKVIDMAKRDAEGYKS